MVAGEVENPARSGSELLEQREAGEGISRDGPREPPPGEPKRRHAAAGAGAVAAHALPAAARAAVAGPRGAEEDVAAGGHGWEKFQPHIWAAASVHCSGGQRVTSLCLR